MAICLVLLLGLIVFQGCSIAAPSENSHPVITTSVEGEVTLDTEPAREKHQTNNKEPSGSQRQKRFYDYTGFDYPPYDFPFPYPSQPHYSKRDGAHNTAVYGTEDTLGLIFKRLQEIVRDVRTQNVPRPVHTPIPAFIPIFYVPQYDCGCSNNNQGPKPPINNNPTPPAWLPPTSSDTTPTKAPLTNPTLPPIEATTSADSNVTFGNRIGLEDKKQNWGIVTNKPDLNAIVGDGSRPINFDPIPPEEPMDIPVPPVEHGTVQAGANHGLPQTPNQITSTPKSQTIPAPNFRPGRPIVPDTPSTSENFVPSLCDGAIVSCCNRPQITNKCFEALGCEDPSIYGNPCDPNVQLMVINKFRYFQKRRAG